MFQKSGFLVLSFVNSTGRFAWKIMYVGRGATSSKGAATGTRREDKIAAVREGISFSKMMLN